MSCGGGGGGGCGGGGCGGGEAEEKRAAPPRKACERCGEPARLVFHGKQPVCGGCLVYRTVSFFRKEWGRYTSKGDVCVGSVLLAFSGSAASVAALRLTLGVRPENPAWKRYFRLEALHVDDTAVLPRLAGDEAARAESVAEAVRCAEAAGLAGELVHVVPLRLALLDDGAADDGDDGPLRRLFEGVEAPSDREDLLEALRTRLIAREAARRGFRHALLAGTASRAARAVLAGTCKGRGLAVPLEAVGRDRRFGASFLCPMRALLTRDAALYCRVEGLPTAFRPAFTTGLAGRAGGIDGLTEAFLADLRTRFGPTAVWNVLRTAQKLVPPPQGTCALCDRATAPESGAADDERPGGLGPSHAYGPAGGGGGGAAAAGGLCYACSKLAAAARAAAGDSEAALPPALRPVPREAMREQIGEFLLGDDE